MPKDILNVIYIYNIILFLRKILNYYWIFMEYKWLYNYHLDPTDTFS